MTEPSKPNSIKNLIERLNTTKSKIPKKSVSRSDSIKNIISNATNQVINVGTNINRNVNKIGNDMNKAIDETKKEVENKTNIKTDNTILPKPPVSTKSNDNNKLSRGRITTNNVRGRGRGRGIGTGRGRGRSRGRSRGVMSFKELMNNKGIVINNSKNTGDNIKNTINKYNLSVDNFEKVLKQKKELEEQIIKSKLDMIYDKDNIGEYQSNLNTYIIGYTELMNNIKSIDNTILFNNKEFYTTLYTNIKKMNEIINLSDKNEEYIKDNGILSNIRNKYLSLINGRVVYEHYHVNYIQELSKYNKL
jgi:hypothetical protein